MEYTIEREMPGRVRVKLAGPVPDADMGPLCALLGECGAIEAYRVYPRIGSIAVSFEAQGDARDRALAFLGGIDREAVERFGPHWHNFSV